jgi:hypothetical protein
MAINVLGSRRLGARNTTIASLYWGFNRAYRNHPMPHQSEAFFLAGRTQSSQRRMFVGLSIALALGCATAMLYYTRAAYIYGGAVKMRGHIIGRANECYVPLAELIDNPTAFDARSLSAIVLGLVTLLTGMTLNTRLMWWPLHPIGYVVSGSWSMQLLWCPMAIAWGVKTLVTRYGGHQAMKRVAPLAFGLILGDLSGGCLWSLIGMALHRSIYAIWE